MLCLSNAPTELLLIAMTMMEKLELRSPMASTVTSTWPSSSVVAIVDLLNLTCTTEEHRKENTSMQTHEASALIVKVHVRGAKMHTVIKYYIAHHHCP